MEPPQYYSPSTHTPQTSPVHCTSDNTTSNNDRFGSIGIAQFQAASPVYVESDDSSDEGSRSMSHPNKYPVQIENHGSKQCGYRRQPTR